MKVIVQKWEESERGWGVRPDGYSLHRTEQDRVQYIQGHNDLLPATAPDEYSRPRGTPYEADVSDDVMRDAKSVRIFNNSYPGSGGKDGWVNAAPPSTGGSQ